MKQVQQSLNEIEEDYFDRLERQWKQSQPQYNQYQWNQIFPEYQSEIPTKITELQTLHDKVTKIIKHNLAEINKDQNQEVKLIRRELLKIEYGTQLLLLKTQISNLKLLLPNKKEYSLKCWISEEEKQQALSVPIENLVNTNLKKSGNKLIGLCPLHTEKTPSFTIFTNTNTGWCFGCNQGGNTIKLVMLLHSCSFKNAVRTIIEGQKL